jgi:hypothetical protein
VGSERVSENEVGDAGSERCEVGVDIQGGRGAHELRRRCAGLGDSGGGASGEDNIGTVGGAAADDGVGGAGGGMGGRDGGGAVRQDDARCGRARHGDSVDAVDGRGDVDGGLVLGLARLGEGADEERKEGKDDLLEGAHLEVVVGLVVGEVCDWCERAVESIECW